MKKVIVYALLLIIFCYPLFSQDGTGDEINTKGLKKKDAIKKTRDLKTLDEYASIKRWAIVIGVNDYQDSYISDLEKAQNDAKVLTDVLKHEGQFDYVFSYTDDTYKESEHYPSLNNIVAKMEYLKNEIRPNDIVFFSFSGHGISDVHGRSYLLMADTVISQPYRTSLPLYEIQEWLEEMKVKKNIVLLDACRNILEKTKGINTKTLANEMSSQAEISAVVYATSPGEYSYEHDKQPYGVFTTYIIEGLKGSADRDGDIIVTFDELRKHVEGGVKEWAIEHSKAQKPYTSIKGEFHGDLALSVIPLKERASYNPLSFKNNFAKQLLLYQGLNYSGIAGIVVGTIGLTTGCIVGGIGLYQYDRLYDGATTDEFDLYWTMKDVGFYSAIGFTALALSAAIPLGISYAVKPKNGKKLGPGSFALDINYYRNNISMAASIKF